MPESEKSPMPTVPATIPMTRKSWRILIPITPLLLRSMSRDITGVASPPIMPERKRAEVMAFDLSTGFGDMAADRPQNGMSPIV